MLGWTCEHVRLYCEITSSRLSVAAHGWRVLPDRERVLETQHLRELYEDQRQPLQTIADQAGCAATTVRALLEIDGLPIRVREVAPDKAVDREWFEREYVQRHRSMPELAAERGVSKTYMADLALRWRIPIRARGNRYTGIGHLELNWQPSQALYRVAYARYAQDRLAFLTQLPGHRDFAAAARTFYGGSSATVVQRLRAIERSAGFEIFDRKATPITATTRGRDLLREASLVLRAFDPSWTAPGAVTTQPDVVAWNRRVQAKRESSGSCALNCRDHPGHVYTLCYGAPTAIQRSDYLPGDPARDYPVTHYVGWSGKRLANRIRAHGALSAKFVTMIQPGTVMLEAETKLTGRCPMCDASLWFYAECPTYPGWTSETNPSSLHLAPLTGPRASSAPPATRH